MSRVRIVWDRERQRWYIGGLRRRKSFRTLLEAENYLTRGECPDEVSADD